MNGIKLGQYVYGNSFLHLLDPRSKIMACLIMIIAIFINNNWYYLLFLSGLIIAGIITSGINSKKIIGSLRSIRYLLLVTFVFQALLTPGHPVWELGRMSITIEGLTLGLINLLRLVILYLGSMLLLMTTTPIKLSAGIESMLMPLYKLKLPVQNFATILSISFRFIPTLVEEAAIIKNAQRARGAQFYSPNLGVRLKSYMAILIPIFEASLSRAEELGEAMDSRCYAGHPNKLRMSTLVFKFRDLALLGFMLSVLLLGIFSPF